VIARLHITWIAIVVAALAGCSGVSPGLPLSPAGADGGGSSSAGDDASTSAAVDGGATIPVGGGGKDSGGPSGSDSGSVAAAHAPLPQFPFGATGGTALLTAIQIVTVTWKADTENLATELQAFASTLAQSAWWSAVGGSYCLPGSSQCIGTGGTALAKASGDFPLQPVTDSATGQTGSFRKFINDKMVAGDLPAPTPNTLYVFYLPQGFSVTVDGSPSCGYHGAATVTLPAGAGTAAVPYVVIPRCQIQGQTDLDVAIFAASREIIEAATDPFFAQGKVGFSLSDPAWSPSGHEVGDFCVDPGGGGADVTTEGSYSVSRSWSNGSAAASHDPCVPIPSGEVYYNVAPEESTAQGITLAVGNSATFKAVAFSDGPISAWKVGAQSLAGVSVLKTVLDKTSVSNGDVVSVTVTLTGAPTDTVGGKSYARFALVSTGADGKSHFWPVIVYAQ
jgi:hypothetical protein